VLWNFTEQLVQLLVVHVVRVGVGRLLRGRVEEELILLLVQMLCPVRRLQHREQQLPQIGTGGIAAEQR
jgi:hypothetical protein